MGLKRAITMKNNCWDSSGGEVENLKEDPIFIQVYCLG
jgi:hypothetical protein